mmetsp:Transcript_779/g.2171  ORF Transcript_779/g.2171 Transcript_779/m.2171 type:complete len:590 (-) Transcript_779:165-1934(-)
MADALLHVNTDNPSAYRSASSHAEVSADGRTYQRHAKKRRHVRRLCCTPRMKPRMKTTLVRPLARPSHRHVALGFGYSLHRRSRGAHQEGEPDDQDKDEHRLEDHVFGRFGDDDGEQVAHNERKVADPERGCRAPELADTAGAALAEAPRTRHHAGAHERPEKKADDADPHYALEGQVGVVRAVDDNGDHLVEVPPQRGRGGQEARDVAHRLGDHDLELVRELGLDLFVEARPADAAQRCGHIGRWPVHLCDRLLVRCARPAVPVPEVDRVVDNLAVAHEGRLCCWVDVLVRAAEALGLGHVVRTQLLWHRHESPHRQPRRVDEGERSEGENGHRTYDERHAREMGANVDTRVGKQHDGKEDAREHRVARRQEDDRANVLVPQPPGDLEGAPHPREVPGRAQHEQPVRLLEEAADRVHPALLLLGAPLVDARLVNEDVDRQQDTLTADLPVEEDEEEGETAGGKAPNPADLLVLYASREAHLRRHPLNQHALHLQHKDNHAHGEAHAERRRAVEVHSEGQQLDPAAGGPVVRDKVVEALSNLRARVVALILHGALPDLAHAAQAALKRRPAELHQHIIRRLAQDRRFAV